MSNLNETEITTRESWLAARKGGIGGSDIATLVGLNPWKTPYQLWLDKTNRSEETRHPDAEERMHFGTLLEAVIAEEYATRTGHRVQRVNTMMHHADHPMALANIDRAIVAEGSRARWSEGKLKGATRLLECKTAHALAQSRTDEWGEAETDQVPQHYWLQCQWYMGVTQVPICDLAVLFGGQKLHIYTIHFDSEVFAELLNQAGAWWERHIIGDTPPDPNTAAECRQRWIRSHEGSVEVSAEVAEAVAALRRIKMESKVLEDLAAEKEAILLAAMGEAEIATYDGMKLATWKSNKDSQRFDSKAFEAAHPDLYAQYLKTQSGARVLRLTK